MENEAYGFEEGRRIIWPSRRFRASQGPRAQASGFGENRGLARYAPANHLAPRPRGRAQRDNETGLHVIRISHRAFSSRSGGGDGRRRRGAVAESRFPARCRQDRHFRPYPAQTGHAGRCGMANHAPAFLYRLQDHRLARFAFAQASGGDCLYPSRTMEGRGVSARSRGRRHSAVGAGGGRRSPQQPGLARGTGRHVDPDLTSPFLEREASFSIGTLKRGLARDRSRP